MFYHSVWILHPSNKNPSELIARLSLLADLSHGGGVVGRTVLVPIIAVGEISKLSVQPTASAKWRGFFCERGHGFMELVWGSFRMSLAF